MLRICFADTFSVRIIKSFSFETSECGKADVWYESRLVKGIAKQKVLHMQWNVWGRTVPGG